MEFYSFIGLVRISLCKDDTATLSAGSYANTGTSVGVVVSLVHGVKLEWEGPFQDGSDTHADGRDDMLSSCHTEALF